MMITEGMNRPDCSEYARVAFEDIGGEGLAVVLNAMGREGAKTYISLFQPL